MSVLELDKIKSHPLHVHTLSASKGMATMRCLDCGVRKVGTYSEIVEWWEQHVSNTGSEHDG